MYFIRMHCKSYLVADKMFIVYSINKSQVENSWFSTSFHRNSEKQKNRKLYVNSKIGTVPLQIPGYLHSIALHANATSKIEHRLC